MYFDLEFLLLYRDSNQEYKNKIENIHSHLQTIGTIVENPEHSDNQHKTNIDIGKICKFYKSRSVPDYGAS